jgi:putative flippase GtrA
MKDTFPWRRPFHHQLVRFIGMGATNTILTFVLYEALIFIIPYQVAYTISFVAGVAFAAAANSRLVFRIRLTWQTGIRFIIFYVSSYLVGLCLIVVAVEKFGLSELMAPFLVVAIMLPINFFGSRLALSGQ